MRIQILPLFIIFTLVNVFGQTQSRGYLNHLQGSWNMSGTVLKKPVIYTAEGTWILRDQFFSFHMKDVTVPSAYEATFFIGIDSTKSEYVAHWLDSFGGAGARVVGFGPLSGEKIEIIYPYSEGRFRNLINYDSRKDEWTLLIESEGAAGRWSVFAQYRITRKDKLHE
jgi:hypothetical protein